MSSNNVLYLTLGSLLYVLFIAIIYTFKKKVKTNENRVYSIMLGLTVITSIFELLLAVFYPNNLVLLGISMKLYLFFIILWISFMFIYLYIVLYKKNYDKTKNHLCLFFGLFFLLSLILVFVLKVEYAVKDGILMYSTGPAVNYTFGVGGVILTVISLLMIFNYKKITNKKYVPIILFVVLLCVTTIIQKIYPEYLLINLVFGITISLMYHTIENPDVKILELEEAERNIAVKANQSKSDFLANMSHELRTSLNIIVGLSEDINSYKNYVPNDVKEDTVDIVNASNTLLEIIGNILDITKIESGKFEIINTYYNPKEEFESLAKIMRTKVAEKPIDFIVNISSSLPNVLYGDRVRIKQIINNFLSNAIKYTEEGRVEFRVNWDNESNSLDISVSDTGNGIKEEDMKKLFTKFERLQVEKISSVQGTGLGLSITKDLIELMNGILDVQSEYKKGSTFNVKIPQTIGNDDDYNKIKDQINYDEIHVDYYGKRVLIVDDYKLNIKVLKKALKNYNLVIDECYDGKETINKIYDGNTYDLVLLDVRMPNVTGDRLVKQMKKIKGFNAPVIALTADAMSTSSEKYLKAGFDGYLAKPFSREEISKLLSSVFDK